MLQDPTDVVVHMPIDRHAVGGARAAVRRHLAGHSPGAVADTLVVVAAELVTTSLLLGDLAPGDALSLRLRRGPALVGVEVSTTPRAAEDGYGMVRRALSDTRSRGLRLVDALSTRWGLVYDDRDGTRMWAELATAPAV